MYGPGKKGSSTHYQVYNLNTKNDWWWRGDGKKTLILCNPFSTPAVSVVHDFLKDHDLDMKNIVNIGMLDDKLRNDVLPLKDSSKETHVSVIQEKTSGDPVFISDYIKKNNMRFLKHETVNTEIYIKPYSKEEENVDCPVIIKGSNLPKIKLDKEFNYVGKIYFQPFPKRDHGDDIE
ncbi:MAG: hypothetical protein PF518_04880 [Spirochaetaceae bacterium]|jgi:hypothetical protein|nr:hypothetical protein [Spirochaetaceae bacterium]